MNPSCSNKIQRTLCIGLGGTGRDILMQIRRLIIDRSGRLEALPVVSFLHIDTDTGAGNLSGLNTGSTYRGENILFTPAERVIATMTSKEVNKLIQELEQKREFDRYSPYNLMGRWLPPKLIDNIGSIEDGTGGMRAAGRLSFFHNYRKIRKAIKTAENRTKGHETTLIDRGLTVDSGLNIFLVGSFCGGTGSGMFLDTAYSIRQAYRDVETQLIGYWIIDSELYGNTPNMNANTYAALAELDRYSATNTHFQACYDPQELVCIDSDRPPFDFTYLIADRSETNNRINDKNKIFSIVARKIFIDFNNETSTLVNNHEHKFEKQSTLTSPSYQAFGLSRIYIPQDRIEQITLNEIGLEFISFWLQGHGEDIDPLVLLDRFFLKCGIAANDRFLPVRLQKLVPHLNNRTFNENLKVWATKTECEIAIVKTAIDRQRGSLLLSSECRDLFLQVCPEFSEHLEGAWITKIKKGQLNLSSIISGDIFIFLEGLLSPSKLDFSLNNSRSWLEATLTYIERERREIEDFLAAKEELLDVEAFDLKLKKLERRLQEIENQKGWLGFIDSNKQKNLAFQSEMMQVLLNLVETIEDNFNIQLYQAALATNRELAKFIRSLISELSKLNAVLRSVEGIYHQKIAELERFNPDEIIGEALFGKNNIEFHKQKLFSTKDEYLMSIEISKQILLAGFSIKPSLIYFSIEAIDSDAAGENYLTYYPTHRLDDRVIYERTFGTISKYFTAQEIDDSTGIVEQLFNSYSPDDIKIKIKQVLARSQLLLALVEDEQLDSTWETISFSQDLDCYSQEFRDLLINHMNINVSNLRSIKNKQEITIVREQSFSNLAQIVGMDRMREHHSNQSD